MKNINQFIFEKLKLNSQSQLKDSDYIIIWICHMKEQIRKYLRLFFRSFLKTNHYYAEDKIGEIAVVFKNDINNITEVMNNLSTINLKYNTDYSFFKLPHKYVNNFKQFVDDFENGKIDLWSKDFEKFEI